MQSNKSSSGATTPDSLHVSENITFLRNGDLSTGTVGHCARSHLSLVNKTALCRDEEYPFADIDGVPRRGWGLLSEHFAACEKDPSCILLGA